MKGLFVLLILGCGPALLRPLPAAERPNVLVILADQWRAQALGYAGDGTVRTPHLDTLQRRSVTGTHMISTIPVCTPMRASFLTGQRALTHGLFVNDVQLSPDAETIAKVFSRAGYDTGFIGKWHVDGRGRSAFIPRERRQGFDYWKALECTHAYNRSYYYADTPEKKHWPGYDAVEQTADAQLYLRARAESEKPFFLVLSWGPPHDPYQTAPERYRAMYAAEKIELRPNVPKALRDHARKALAGYYAHCTALDDCVGQLVQTLQETGLAENTVLLFTADHGDLLGSHGAFNKQQPFDESIRVPLLVHWPKGLGVQPRVVDGVMTSEDLMPTLLGLAGVPIPASVEGVDFSGYLRGGANPTDGAALFACITPFGQWERRVGGREFRGLRTRRHTYVRDLNGPWLLFDNEADPYQMHNLINDPAHRALQAALDAALQKKLVAAKDDFRPGDSYVRQWGHPVDEHGTVPYKN